MKTSVKSLMVLGLVAALTFFASDQTVALPAAPQRLLQTQTYTTTTTRTNNVNTYCPANLNRSTLVSATDVTDAQSQRTSINTQLGLDGYLSTYPAMCSSATPSTATPLPASPCSLAASSPLPYSSGYSSSSYSWFCCSVPICAAAAPAPTAAPPSAARSPRSNSTPSASFYGPPPSSSSHCSLSFRPQSTVSLILARFHEGVDLRSIHRQHGLRDCSFRWWRA